MLGNYYYHQIIRKTLVSFGTLFNDIWVRHTDANDGSVGEMKVPLAYGPSQKFLARLEQQADLNRATQITLPRMSFEMNNIAYDPTRKVSVTQTFKAVYESDGSKVKKVFMPVPYNIGFELNIMCKLNDDALQIIEQILPYFQPSFNISVELIDSIGEKRDIPIVLDSMNFVDDYEGDFSTRRALIYTLQFTAKTYLFGRIAETTDGIIRKVQVDYYGDTNLQTANRELRYVATPRAQKDYDADADTTGAVTNENLTTSETLVDVNDTSAFAVGNRIIIDSEIMRINKKTSNQITVTRGYSRTIKAEHIKGSKINVLSTADDVLIAPGDDFGFNETSSFFQDNADFSPTRQTDI